MAAAGEEDEDVSVTTNPSPSVFLSEFTEKDISLAQVCFTDNSIIDNHLVQQSECTGLEEVEVGINDT